MEMTRNKIDFVPDEEDAKRLQSIVDQTGHKKSEILRVALKIVLAEMEGIEFKRPQWFDNAKKIIKPEEDDWLEDAKNGGK